MLNIAGYKFIALPQAELASLRQLFLDKCLSLEIKGTILLSTEGININLSGPDVAIKTFQDELAQNLYFADMTFRQNHSAEIAFKRLKVKIKKEIITLRQPEVNPDQTRAPTISPQELQQWLDEKKDILLLDTRNDFEVNYGTFNNAVNLHMKNFCEFPQLSETIDPEKTIVMFCTGGIRCEKAALHLLKKGYKKVYQLEGGILNYFAEVGRTHYQGECFVFDERIKI